jgi:hypothetical protein
LYNLGNGGVKHDLVQGHIKACLMSWGERWLFVFQVNDTCSGEPQVIGHDSLNMKKTTPRYK